MAKKIQIGLNVDKLVTEAKKAGEHLTQVGKQAELMAKKLNKKHVGPEQLKIQQAEVHKALVKTTKSINDITAAEKKHNDGRTKGAKAIKAQATPLKELLITRRKNLIAIQKDTQAQIQLQKVNGATARSQELLAIATKKANLANAQSKTNLNRSKIITQRIKRERLVQESIKRTARLDRKAAAEVSVYLAEKLQERGLNYKKYTLSVAQSEKKLTQFIKNQGAKRVNNAKLNEARIELIQARKAEVIAGGQRAVERASRQQEKLASAPSPLEISFKSIARIVGVSLGFRAFSGLIAGIKSATTEALELSKRITEIQTISQQSGRGFEAWSAGLREISNSAGISILEQAEAAYQALSNQVVRTADTLEFLTAANKLAFATTSTTTTAINVLSSSMNSYGLTVNDATRLSAIYFKTIELGRIRLEDIEQTFGKLEVIGDTLGVSLEEISASMATLTNQGINARQASTQLRGIFNKLIKPTGDMKKLFDELGVSTGAQAVQLFGFSGLMEKIAEKVADGSAELGKLINRQRGLTGAFVLTGRAAAIYESNLAKISDSSTTYQRAIDLVGQSTSKTVAQFTTEIQNFFIEVAQSLTDGLASTIRFFKAAGIGVKEFANLLTGTLAGAAVLAAIKLKLLVTAIGGVKAALLASPLALFAIKAIAIGVAFTTVTKIIESFTGAVEDTSEAIAKLNQQNLNTAVDNTNKIVKELNKIETAALRSGQRIRAANVANQKNIQDQYKVTAEKVSESFKEVEREYQRNQQQIENLSKRGLAKFTAALSSRVALSNQLLNIRLNRITSTNEESSAEKITKLQERQLQLARKAEESGKSIDIAKDKELSTQIERIKKEESIRKQVSLELQKEIATSEELLKTRLAGADDKEALAIRRANKERVDALRQREIAIALEGRQFDVAEKLANEAFEEAKKKQEAIGILADKIEESNFKKRLVRIRLEEQFRRRVREAEEVQKSGQKEIESQAKTVDKVKVIESQIESLAGFLKVVEAQKLKTDTEGIEERLAGLRKDLEGRNLELLNEKTAEPFIKEVKELSSRIHVLRETLKSQQDTLNEQTSSTKNIPDNVAKILKQERKSFQDAIKPLEDDQSGLAILRSESKQEKSLADPLLPNEVAKLANRALERLSTHTRRGNSREFTNQELLDILALARINQGNITQSTVSATQAKIISLTEKVTKSASEFERLTNHLKEAETSDDTRFRTTTELNQRIANQLTVIADTFKTIARRRDEIFPPEEKNLGGAIKYFSQGGGPKGSDTVPAWLTPGEYVVKRSMAQKHMGLLRQINAGYFDQGGIVGKITPSVTNYYNEGGEVGGGVTSVGDINVSLNSSGNSTIDARAIGAALKTEIRRGRLTL